MRVRAKADRPTAAQQTSIGGTLIKTNIGERVGGERLVLGILVALGSRRFGTGIWVTFQDDAGTGVTAPLALYDVVDPRPSVYWEFRENGDTATFWPRTFYQDHFFEDAAEGETQQRRQLSEVRQLLATEHGE